MARVDVRMLASRTRELLTIAVMLAVSGVGLATAQTPPPAPTTPVASYDTPAHVSLIDGNATLEREGRAEELTAGVSLLQGDRIRTTNGRAEILFPDGSALYLDSFTQVEFLSDTLVRAHAGRLTVFLAGAADNQRELRYQVDTPGGVVRLLTPGEFRVGLLDGASGRGREVVLEVVRGEAELSTERGAVPVRAGERSVARDGSAPAFPLTFNSARLDAFDVWTAERRDARIGTRSTQYLPSPVQTYAGTFDRYGSWEYESPYGYVWYPRAPAGWRPYVNGSWRHSGLWGWTWDPYDPWGWPTHHFGRWGLSRIGAWYWIPSHRWAPAWVSWGYSPGYLAWCPLGYDNRPIFSFVNYNVGNYYEPFRAWNVIRHNDFGHGRRINTLLVDHRTFGRGGRGDRPTFVERPLAPATQQAPLRASMPVRAPSRGALGYAVPRDGFQSNTRPPVNQGPRAPDSGQSASDGGRGRPANRTFSIMGPGGNERRARPEGERAAPSAGDNNSSNPNGGAAPRRSPGAERGQAIQGPARQRGDSQYERAPEAARPERRYERAPAPDAPRPDRYRAPEQARPESGRPESGRPEYSRPERRAPERAPDRPAARPESGGERRAPERRPPSAERPAPPPRNEGRPPSNGGGGGGGARERSGARGRGGR